MKLLGSNTKIEKTNKYHTDYLTYILSLASADSSGNNVCPEASPACKEDCLFYAGFGVYKKIQDARIAKTNLFFEDRNLFISLLIKDIESAIRIGERDNLKPAVRLNGFSDLAWEKLVPELFDYPVQYYDYTKIRKRYANYLDGKLPENYHLTFSRSEINESACLSFLKEGGSVAVCGEKRPRYWNDYITIDGDKSDARFLDKQNRVVWLLPKGRMKYDTTGFVVRN